ncbi:MAG: hypothetical protein MN733_17415, partial [Nitrososphaera sp.]|nr:hypothetical protein [Nitrososphaera sp.]
RGQPRLVSRKDPAMCEGKKTTMSKIVLHMQTSLDGSVATPNNESINIYGPGTVAPSGTNNGSRSLFVFFTFKALLSNQLM